MWMTYYKQPNPMPYRARKKGKLIQKLTEKKNNKY